MRKYLLISSIICGLLVFASSSWAYSLNVDFTDVGDSDKIIARTKLTNSSYGTELAWLKTILGADISITEKYDSYDKNLDWEGTENVNVWALNLPENPEYYYIKTGNIKADPYPKADPKADRDIYYEHFLYENKAGLAWAVIDLTEWLGADVNIGKVSHIGTTLGVPVPEPATLLLFGFGLLGLAGIGRKFQKHLP